MKGNPTPLFGSFIGGFVPGERLSYHTLAALINHLPERRFFPSGRRLIVVNACESGQAVKSEPNELIGPGISKPSAAAQLAVMSNSWTIGAAGEINSDTGEAYTTGHLGQRVPSKWIMFDPKGNARLEFGSKMTAEDWAKAESLGRKKLDWAQ